MSIETMEFFWRLDDERIVAAIRRAEQMTSGEIRVYVSESEVDDPVSAAQKQFEQMGMTATRQRNGVLIFIAPSRRKLAVLGDVGVQAKVAPDLWTRVVERMTADFRRGDRTAGLVAAVEILADALAPLFPVGSRDVNELTDSVTFERT